ncbi:MAG: TIM barrel protein [Candidatus Nanoarchaeia archaeon]|nr:TIM barrel protein [Candidatus Nanoarchaeia archaeon]
MKVGIKTYADERGYNYIPKIIDYVDFIEILPLPDNGIYKNYADFDTEIRIHAPHQGQGANPADKNAVKRTMQCMKVAIEAADLFDSKTIVVHPGVYEGVGSAMRAIDFLKQFNDKRFIIENLPAECSRQRELGSTAEEIEPFLKSLDCGMCLDFGHASITERTSTKDYKQIITDFLKFNPKYFHIMGGSIKENIDHKNLFYGDFNIEFFKQCIPNDAYVCLETPHDAEMQKKEIEYIKKGKSKRNALSVLNFWRKP